MTKRISNCLEFDPIHIDNNDNNHYACLYYTVPDRQSLFALVVEQLPVFILAFDRTIASRIVLPRFNIKSRKKQRLRY